MGLFLNFGVYLFGMGFSFIPGGYSRLVDLIFGRNLPFYAGKSTNAKS